MLLKHIKSCTYYTCTIEISIALFSEKNNIKLFNILNCTLHTITQKQITNERSLNYKYKIFILFQTESLVLSKILSDFVFSLFAT